MTDERRSASLAEVLAVLDEAYPRRLAEDWDTGIGLTCGDPAAPVSRILFAVDADPAVVAEAVGAGAQLLVTHHPLLFRPVQTVAADTGKGALVHRLLAAGIGHFSAHTNADRAEGGVNDALAAALGLVDVRPLVPARGPELEKIVVFTPRAATDRMIAALAAAGAGALGDYSGAAFVGTGEGRFTPLPGARPAIGAVGVEERVAEDRVEMVLPASHRAAVVAAMRAAHPYEEPAFEVYATQPLPSETIGLGRVGVLPEPMTLAAFTRHVADRLPATAGGVRAAGDPDRTIRRVAVCGGAGGGQLEAATAAGADVYVTADLTHHVAAEHTADPARPALVDATHFATEWPWLSRAAALVRARFGDRIATVVSTIVTDPWRVHASLRPRD